MSNEELIRRIRSDGFCLIENVIPADKCAVVRDSLLQAEQQQRKHNQAELARTRGRGHRKGVKGVGPVMGVINHTQTFAPYLADARIMAIAESFFGPFVRISATDCVITFPGNERGYWHADWPYNQTNASHIQAPYPDIPMHLASIWMVTDFSAQNGGTFLVPGSHRSDDNPSAAGINDLDRDRGYPTEIQAQGKAGSVVLYDSRLWHAVAPNQSTEPRVAMIIRYAPWWLNLNPARVGSVEHTQMVVETGGKNYDCPTVLPHVYDALPDHVKPLYRHWVGQ